MEFKLLGPGYDGLVHVLNQKLEKQSHTGWQIFFEELIRQG